MARKQQQQQQTKPARFKPATKPTAEQRAATKKLDANRANAKADYIEGKTLPAQRGATLTTYHRADGKQFARVCACPDSGLRDVYVIGQGWTPNVRAADAHALAEKQLADLGHDATDRRDHAPE